MIFHCPNCEKKYQVADRVIGDEGKTVRCVACAHEWLQKPESVDPGSIEREADEVSEDNGFSDVDERNDSYDAEYSEADKTAEKIKALIENSNTVGADESDSVQDDSVEGTIDGPDEQDELPPIPQSVKPTTADEVQKTDSRVQNVAMLAKVNGLVAAMLVFLALFIVSIFFRGDIVKAWPASAMIYDKAGFEVPVQGEGLVIENFTAKALESEDGKTTLVMRGRVINLTQDIISVPDMIVYFDDQRSASENSSWVIEPPVKELTAGESFSFTSNYENPDKNLKSIILTFRQKFI